jgi:hypothetical protein
MGRAAPAAPAPPAIGGFDDEMEIDRGGTAVPFQPSPARAQAAAPAAAQAAPPARPPAQAAPPPTQQGVKTPFAGANTGRVIDDPFEDGGDGADLKLELDIPRASKQPQARLSGAPGGATPATSTRPGAVAPVGMTSHVSQRPPAMGGAPAPAVSVEDEIERQQAAEIAAYGPAPTQFWLAPRYAWKVRTRQAELRKELEARRNEAQQAATHLEDALVAFAERIRPVAENMSFYLRAFDPIRALESQVRTMDGAAAAEMDAHRARMREIEARVTQAEQVLSQLQLEERRLADDLAQAEATLQRAEAKLKRADIEMRHVPSTGSMPASQRRG